MKIALTVLISIAAFLVFLFLLWLLSLMTARKRESAREFTRYNYAHRGLHDGARIPENSLSAFARAAENGFAVELDVQLSRDGEVMVFHDEKLSRVCGKPGYVRDYTKEELCTFALLGNESEHVPTFSEVLAVIDGRVPILVEIKAEYAATETTEKAQALLDAYKGKYTVESFNPFVVRWYRKNRPEVVRGLLCARFTKDKDLDVKLKHRLLQGMIFNFLCRPDFIAYNAQNRNYFVFTVTCALYKPFTFAWTVRDKKTLSDCRDFDAVIFENLKTEDFEDED